MNKSKPKKMTDLSVDPMMLLQLHFSLAPSYILRAAVELNVFSSLAKGHVNAAAMAKDLNLTERGTQYFLDTLVGLGLLKKVQKKYALTGLTRQFCVTGQPDYLGRFLLNNVDELWKDLPQVVRSGVSKMRLEKEHESDEFFRELVQNLHIMNRLAAQTTARTLKIGQTKELNVLDMACGSGVWGIAMGEAYPQAQITFQDFPKMLGLTKEYIQKHNLSERARFLPGDLKETEFGENRFDVAILGNIVHSEGVRSSQILFRKIFEALRPKGRIVIADMIPHDDRSGPPFPLIFGLLMLVTTTEGGTYTLKEYKTWLKSAGFKNIHPVDIHSHSPLVVGER